MFGTNLPRLLDRDLGLCFSKDLDRDLGLDLDLDRALHGEGDLAFLKYSTITKGTNGFINQIILESPPHSFNRKFGLRISHIY